MNVTRKPLDTYSAKSDLAGPKNVEQSQYGQYSKWTRIWCSIKFWVESPFGFKLRQLHLDVCNSHQSDEDGVKSGKENLISDVAQHGKQILTSGPFRRVRFT